MIEQQIEVLLKNFSKSEILNFGITCVERVIDLYKLFDNSEDISNEVDYLKKGTGYSALKEIFRYQKENLLSINEDKGLDLIMRGEDLIVDGDIFGNSVEVSVAQTVSQSLVYLLEYALYNDTKKIINCVSNNLEILNQLKSDYYTKIINRNADDNELESFLKPIFQNEMEVEIKIIELIISNSLDLDKFVKENLITST